MPCSSIKIDYGIYFVKDKDDIKHSKKLLLLIFLMCSPEIRFMPFNFNLRSSLFYIHPWKNNSGLFRNKLVFSSLLKVCLEEFVVNASGIKTCAIIKEIIRSH